MRRPWPRAGRHSPWRPREPPRRLGRSPPSPNAPPTSCSGPRADSRKPASGRAHHPWLSPEQTGCCIAPRARRSRRAAPGRASSLPKNAPEECGRLLGLWRVSSRGSGRRFDRTPARAPSRVLPRRPGRARRIPLGGAEGVEEASSHLRSAGVHKMGGYVWPGALFV